METPKLTDTVKIGSKGGKARVARLSSRQLSESGSHAAKSRWAAYYKLNPSKLKAKQNRDAKKNRKKTIQTEEKGPLK